MDWITGLGRIITRPDLPITLQGGEPTQHPDCWEIAAELNSCGKHLDILTNGDFDFKTFIDCISCRVFDRPAKYASIRFSYHVHIHSPYALAAKVFYLQTLGYNIGIWGLDHPDFKIDNTRMANICKTYRIDFRLKELLGEYDGKYYGTLRYLGAASGKKKKALCRTTELLIGPSGHIYRCHSDLYAGHNPIAHILDEDLDRADIGGWRDCGGFGACNACDVKVKTNRLQEGGHTSVEIQVQS